MAQKKKIEVEVPEQFGSDLVQVLHNHPHIVKVWINEDRDWWLTAKAGTTEYSRAQILGTQEIVETLVQEIIETEAQDIVE